MVGELNGDDDDVSAATSKQRPSGIRLFFLVIGLLPGV